MRHNFFLAETDTDPAAPLENPESYIYQRKPNGGPKTSGDIYRNAPPGNPRGVATAPDAAARTLSFPSRPAKQKFKRCVPGPFYFSGNRVNFYLYRIYRASN